MLASNSKPATRRALTFNIFVHPFLCRLLSFRQDHQALHSIAVQLDQQIQHASEQLHTFLGGALD